LAIERLDACCVVIKTLVQGIEKTTSSLELRLQVRAHTSMSIQFAVCELSLDECFVEVKKEERLWRKKRKLRQRGSPDLAFASARPTYHVTHFERSFYILHPPRNNFLSFSSFFPHYTFMKLRTHNQPPNPTLSYRLVGHIGVLE
jgi:hypothetical protein